MGRQRQGAFSFPPARPFRVKMRRGCPRQRAWASISVLWLEMTLMAFKTIVAKFKGKCRRCGGEIRVGQRFRWGGRGNCWHLSAECPANGNGQAQAEESRDGGEYRTCLQGGRCEDFPCCGCHGLHGRELYTPSEPADPYDNY